MDSRLNPFQDKMEKTLNNLEEEYAGNPCRKSQSTYS